MPSHSLYCVYITKIILEQTLGSHPIISSTVYDMGIVPYKNSRLDTVYKKQVNLNMNFIALQKLQWNIAASKHSFHSEHISLFHILLLFYFLLFYFFNVDI